jgi:hypothetical protein
MLHCVPGVMLSLGAVAEGAGGVVGSLVDRAILVGPGSLAVVTRGLFMVVGGLAVVVRHAVARSAMSLGVEGGIGEGQVWHRVDSICVSGTYLHVQRMAREQVAPDRRCGVFPLSSDGLSG